MDNRSEDDGPMYIPARRNFEVVQYPASRRRPAFLWLFDLGTSSIGFCARLVVSSPALAAAYGSFVPDVVVCPIPAKSDDQGSMRLDFLRIRRID